MDFIQGFHCQKLRCYMFLSAISDWKFQEIHWIVILEQKEAWIYAYIIHIVYGMDVRIFS